MDIVRYFFDSTWHFIQLLIVLCFLPSYSQSVTLSPDKQGDA